MLRTDRKIAFQTSNREILYTADIGKFLYEVFTCAVILMKIVNKRAHNVCELENFLILLAPKHLVSR